MFFIRELVPDLFDGDIDKKLHDLFQIYIKIDGLKTTLVDSPQPNEVFLINSKGLYIPFRNRESSYMNLERKYDEICKELIKQDHQTSPKY